MATRRLSPSSKGVAHHVPGRTRLRVPPKHRKKERLELCERCLKRVPGINKVQVNKTTGSIILHHEQTEGLFDAIVEALEEVSEELVEALVEEEPAVGLAIAGAELVGGVVGGIRKNPEELKQLLPLGLLAAGIYKAVRTRSLWEGVAPLVLIYWAFDSFWKLNMQSYQVASRDGHLGDGDRQ